MRSGRGYCQAAGFTGALRSALEPARSPDGLSTACDAPSSGAEETEAAINQPKR